MKDRILKRFNDEIAVLERELKVELPREIQRAREYGDLRENAEYKAAKERQGIVDSRISMLKKRVSEISLMNLDRLPHDKAAFGSTVHLREKDGLHVTNGDPFFGDFLGGRYAGKMALLLDVLLDFGERSQLVVLGENVV